jgi:uncharacterized protein (DUF433 family)
MQVLEKSRGDDLARARLAFSGMTPTQMQEQYGCSGKTRAQILADYEMRNKQVDEAIAWVRYK